MLSSTFNGYNVHLVETESDLDVIRQNLHPRVCVGVDTETTGLSYLRHRMVGLCIACGKSYSPKDYAGYYIPVRHTVGQNVPLGAVVALMQEILDGYGTMFWNRNFDVTMLELDGVKIPFIGKMMDAQVMAHEVYNEKFPSLKEFARRWLKWEMIDFSENNAEAGNFGMTDPKVTFVYAAGDPLATTLLGRYIWSSFPYIHQIYNIDNQVLEAIRLIGKCELYLDYDFLAAEEEKSQMKLRSIQQSIFQYVGYPFNIDSSRQLADALSQFVTLTEKTDKKAWKLDEEALKNLNHPLANMVLDYREVRVYLNTFVKKMSGWKGTPVYANYSSVNAVSGRLSSGTSKGNDYYKPMNFQNVPKTEVKMHIHPHPVLGFYLNHEVEGSLGEMKTKEGLHAAFIAPAGWCWVTADYSGQELTIAANLSKDPVLLTPLKNGGDVHMFVAKTMFGYEDPNHRTKVKGLNFQKLYGGTKYGISKKLGLSLDATQELIDHYDKTLWKLKAWIDNQIASAKKTGFGRTLFGRSVYLSKYLNHKDFSYRSYGERLAVNAPIQGCLQRSLYVDATGDGYLRRWSEFVGDRIGFKDAGEDVTFQGVPVNRGDSELFFVVFNTGDFCVCTSNHKFVRYGSDRELVSIEDAMRIPVRFTKPGKRQWWFRGLFDKTSVEDVASVVLAGRKIPVHDAGIAKAFWKAWVARKRLYFTSWLGAASFRSVADAYGYNLKFVFTLDAVSRRRGLMFTLGRKRAKSGRIVYHDTTGVVENVISPSMITGRQAYPLCGMWHKNTGGDLIRIALIKFMKLQETNAEWRENCRFQLTVHDEVNFVVRPSYLKKAIPIIHRVMDFFPQGFEVPIHVDIGVGTGWGNCLDIEGVTEDNKIIPKGWEVKPDGSIQPK